MSADQTADLRRRNRAREAEVARLRAARAARPTETGRGAGPSGETAFGRRAAWIDSEPGRGARVNLYRPRPHGTVPLEMAASGLAVRVRATIAGLD